MYNFDPYNVLLSIATNIPVLLMTAFVLQGHICSQSPVFPMVFMANNEQMIKGPGLGMG